MVSQTRWSDETKRIFLSALRIDDPAQRAAFLEAECLGSTAVRDQIENLLRVAGGEEPNPLEGLLKTLVIPTAPPKAFEPGIDSIGPYRLREQIGEGGMGVVYRAEQSEPVRRQVALKIIKPGMDSGQVLARFEAERQALALMDHPHIARVLDVGTTAAGCPYFAMELVEGVPITKFCRGRGLSLPERLKLFATVCEATQHAHQKGIIHRDLKPSNVLVIGDKQHPVAKVIDFGIAKILNPDVAIAVAETLFHGVLGTPMYMSPEQMALNSRDVDTRSDIYALGVLLYELLADAPPFDERLLDQSTIDELRRLVAETDPVRPSQRLMSRFSAGEPGGGEIRERAHALRDELDWIAMKAMDKDRERRYQTPDELAADVRRYLAGEPVEACPPSTWYQIKKRARRYRYVLAASALILLSLLGGTSVATWQAVRAGRAEHLAELRLVEANLNRLETQHLLYASDVNLASQSWRSDDIARMRELLTSQIPRDPQQPDFRGFEWSLLWHQSEVQVRELLNVMRPLYCVCLSPDNGLLATSGADAVIRLLETGGWSTVGTIESDQVEINGLHFSPDGSLLASAGDDGTIALWDLSDHREVRRFQAHEKLAYAVRFTGDGRTLVTCGKEPDAQVWTSSGEHLGTIPVSNQWLENLDLSPQGQVALASHNEGLFVWNLPGRELQWHDRYLNMGAVSSVSFSPDGRWLAKGQTLGMVSLFSVGPPKEIVARQIVTDGVHAVAISPDSRYLIAGDGIGFLHLFPIDLEGGTRGIATAPIPQRSRQWHAHQDRIYSVLSLSDSRQIVSAGRDGRLVLSNSQPAPVTTFTELHVNEFVVAGRGTILAAGSGLTRMSSSRPQQPVPVVDAPGEKWTDMTRSRNTGQGFAVQNYRRVWGCTADGSGPEMAFEAEDGEEIGQLAVSPDGTLLAMDLRRAPQGDQHRIAVFCRKQNEFLWTRPSDYAWSMRFSPNGTLLAYSHNNDIQVVDVLTGETRTTLRGHRNAITDIRFLSDGIHMATGSGDRTLKIWTIAAGEEVWSVVAHENEVSSLAEHPDGRTLVTSGRDGMLRFWRWRIRRMAAELPALHWPVNQLEFTADGNCLVCRIENRGLLFYSVPPPTDVR